MNRKEDWTALVQGSKLERLRELWVALWEQAGAPTPKLTLNTRQTRSQLIEWLRERPDDWSFQLRATEEEAEVAEPEEEALAEEVEEPEPEEEPTAEAEEEAETPEETEDEEVEEPVEEASPEEAATVEPGETPVDAAEEAATPERPAEEARMAKAEDEGECLRDQINWGNAFFYTLIGLLLTGIVLAVAVGFDLIDISVPARTVPTEAPAAQEPTEPSPIVQAAPSPTVKPEPTEPSPTVKPEPAPEEPATQAAAGRNFTPGWQMEWYWSPFRDTTDRLQDKSTWETFAEPGVLLDNTAAFDYLSAEETPTNAPEGGFAYIAVGHINLRHDNYKLSLPWTDGNIYLVIIRGLPDDATDVDLNQQVWASDYPRGFGIYSPMPYGAYVSLEWFIQQVENAQESSGDPNCGADGCDKITVVVIELQSHSYRMWEIVGDSRDWARVQ